ncbi:hypothetical protein evm_014554 [Chilo suppressalis]|nr:hypothetical protein evm_014554 [Chilo suppressalis]
MRPDQVQIGTFRANRYTWQHYLTVTFRGLFGGIGKRHFSSFVFLVKKWVVADVESGREELKKEREIMQMVAGLQLGPDELERREVPPHIIRSRHGPR